MTDARVLDRFSDGYFTSQRLTSPGLMHYREQTISASLRTSLKWNFMRRIRFASAASESEKKPSIPRLWPWLTNEKRIEIEKKWFSVVKEIDQELTTSSTGDKFYVLAMFPYPSGALHMGHLRVYTVADVLARYQRMRGHQVIFPMGWDAFGLPAENAALDRGLQPEAWTKRNIEEMRAQMDNLMCLSIDWSREVATHQPEYYRWTQWLFLRLLEHGLAYQKSALVHWDPVDLTVLAAELVDSQGLSWRSGAKVERRPLRQWYLRTLAYSESLLEGLQEVENEEWRAVEKAQRGWIGELDGTFADFRLTNMPHRDTETSGSTTTARLAARVQAGLATDPLSVFTRRPDLLLCPAAITHISVTKDNLLWSCPGYKQQVDGRKLLFLQVGQNGKCRVLSRDEANDLVPQRLNVDAVHPITGELLPVIFDPRLQFLEQEALDAALGSPQFSARDAHLCHIFNLPTPSISLEQPSEKQIEQALYELKKYGVGGHRCSSLRTDWLISRQRYWGTPIPVIHCPSCGVVPVPDKDLPILLPQVSFSQRTNKSVLSELDEWINTTCPKCHQAAQRETDTMDTFVDSSWYFLRHLDPHNSTHPCDPTIAKRDMPVDIYVGGIEHAIRHLFYARFISHFLYDLGYLERREPFRQFLPVGLVQGQTYQVVKSGKFIPASDTRMEKTVNKKGASVERLVEASSGESVTTFWEKMSKSKHNGINPKEVIERHGLESTRLCMLANAGPHRNRKWQEGDVMLGVKNWQSRVWELVVEIMSAMHQQKSSPNVEMTVGEDPLVNDATFQKEWRQTMAECHLNYNDTFTLSTVIARMQHLTSYLLKVPVEVKVRSPSYAQCLADFVVMLGPLAPIFACELWEGVQKAYTDTPFEAHISYDLKSNVLRQTFANSSEAAKIRA